LTTSQSASGEDHRPELVAALVRDYYACFNERRFRDAQTVLATDALLEHIPIGRQDYGVDGYVRFADAWVAAFPDAQFAVEQIEPRSETAFDVHLLATGTHVGTFDIGVCQFRPTLRRVTLRLRQLVTIHGRHLASSTLSFDVNHLIGQLSMIDYAELIDRVERMHPLAEELVRAVGDEARRRDVAERLGRELDAARKALRPHFYR
jgi:predicted ester cyclase